MPPRSAAPRPARSSRAAPASKPARGSKAGKAAAAAAAAPVPEPEEEVEVEKYTVLDSTLATIFSQAQKTTAGHRKLVINLRTTLDQCISGSGSVGSTIGVSGRKSEKVFARAFCRFLKRVLVVKKSEVVGDRCLRLADLFLRNLLGKGDDKKKKKAKDDADGDVEMEEEEPEEEFKETPGVRVVLRILSLLVGFIPSKEKIVRYRTSQFLALLLSNTLADFKFDYCETSYLIFKTMRTYFLQRVYDREAMVRAQAAVGLVRLMEMGVGEDDDDSDEAEDEIDSVANTLITVMQNDPSADVRRTILYNLTPTPATLPYLLERTRDVDATTRRSVFTRLLPNIGDFRQLKLAMREKLIRWGLNDRDESVREAAKKMFNYKWVEDAGGDLLEVLERLDIFNEGIDGGPMDLALKGFWEQRKDVAASLDFDEDFWKSLTAEGAFLIRSFFDYYRVHTGIVDVEDKMPEVTKLASYLKTYILKLVLVIEADEADEAAQLEFVVQQLLLIANSMDYSDEVGRRQMFTLLRESLGLVPLSETVTRLIVDVLRKLSTSEKDFAMIVMEVVAEIYDKLRDEDDEAGDGDADADDNDGEESFQTAKSGGSDDDGTEDEEDEAQAILEMTINVKCLHISQCVLENAMGSLTANMHLVTMLNSLVVPAVRSHQLPVRERGIRCLGLCCLLDRNVAEENLGLFGHCYAKGTNSIKIEALQIISDILLTHGLAVLATQPTLDEKTLFRLFAKIIKSEDVAESVQATAVEALCKLMLASVVSDAELLKTLAVAYFNPATAQNQTLRQTLSYFLPVYTHSSPAHAAMMAAIAVPILHTLHTLADTSDAPPSDTIPLPVIAAHLVEWTDPRKIISLSPHSSSAASKTISENALAEPTTHALLANAALARLPACTKEERKLLVVHVLGKLHLPREAGRELLGAVYDGVTEAIEAGLAVDAAGRNVLAKMEVAVGKWVAEWAAEEGDGATVVGAETEDEDGDGEEGDETVRPAAAAGGEGMEVDGEGEGGEEAEEAEKVAEAESDAETDRTPAVTDVEDSDS
ncbi:nuclear condensing complex subunit [Geopyxis carbonaria]|nr:nuclear condensing complex subunit [Geopyxis carbonaria]